MKTPKKKLLLVNRDQQGACVECGAGTCRYSLGWDLYVCVKHNARTVLETIDLKRAQARAQAQQTQENLP